MEIWLNPSPMNENVLKCNLSLVSVFVLNEVEGEQLTGTKIPTAVWISSFKNTRTPPQS